MNASILINLKKKINENTHATKREININDNMIAKSIYVSSMIRL